MSSQHENTYIHTVSKRNSESFVWSSFQSNITNTQSKQHTGVTEQKLVAHNLKNVHIEQCKLFAGEQYESETHNYHHPDHPCANNQLVEKSRNSVIILSTSGPYSVKRNKIFHPGTLSWSTTHGYLWALNIIECPDANTILWLSCIVELSGDKINW